MFKELKFVTSDIASLTLRFCISEGNVKVQIV
jgi:hypothetical protein